MEDIGTNRKVSPDAKLSWYRLGENDYKKLKKEIERKVNNKKFDKLIKQAGELL